MDGVAEITRQAAVRYIDTGNLAAARDVFEEKLMEWVDYFEDTDKEALSVDEIRSMRNNIALLWIAYAKFEADKKQWNKAVKTFENAVKSSSTSDCALLWSEFAEYYVSRNKISSCQKTYITATQTIKIDVELEDLWNRFLKFMQVSRQYHSMTLEQLKSEVDKECNASESGQPGGEAESKSSSVISTVKPSSSSFTSSQIPTSSWRTFQPHLTVNQLSILGSIPPHQQALSLVWSKELLTRNVDPALISDNSKSSSLLIDTGSDVIRAMACIQHLQEHVFSAWRSQLKSEGESVTVTQEAALERVIDKEKLHSGCLLRQTSEVVSHKHVNQLDEVSAALDGHHKAWLNQRRNQLHDAVRRVELIKMIKLK